MSPSSDAYYQYDLSLHLSFVIGNVELVMVPNSWVFVEMNYINTCEALVLNKCYRYVLFDCDAL